MLFYLTYYTPEEFKINCKPGIHSTYKDGSTYTVTNDPYGYIYGPYNEEHWVGSYCPSHNNTKRLIPKGYPKLRAVIPEANHVYDNSGGGIRCSGGYIGSETSISFPSNRCYAFTMDLYASCAYNSEIFMDMKTEPDDKIIRASIKDFYTCSYNDCYPGYWGPKCQYGPVNFDPKINCDVSLGLHGNGKCICEGASNIQEYCRPGTSEGLILKISQGSETNVIETKTLLDLNALDVTNASPYNIYTITGKFYIPVNGKYIFKVVGNTKAKIKFGTKDTNEISSAFECESKEKTTYLIDTFEGDRLYDIEIKYVTGCAVKDKSISFEWIKPGQEDFKPIPAIYLFH